MTQQTENIIAELQSLKAEVARILDAKSEEFRSVSKAHIDALGQKMRESLGEVGAALKNEEEGIEKIVAAHRIPALAAALAIGIVVGVTMRRAS